MAKPTNHATAAVETNPPSRERLEVRSLDEASGIGPRLEGSLSEYPRPFSTWMVVLLAPALGAIFLVFMPLIGFILAGKVILGKLHQELFRRESYVGVSAFRADSPPRLG